MTVTKTPTTQDQLGQDRTRGALIYRAVRIDNTTETSSVAVAADHGLGNVLVAYGWNRTTGVAIAITISALTTLTSAAHAAGDDITIFAWGTRETPAQLA